LKRKFAITLGICASALAIVLLATQLTACSVKPSKEMVKMIDSGDSILLALAKPSYNIVIKGKQPEKLEWVQLDQLKTYNEFRQLFDEIFNIDIVTENGINGKSGCLYVDEDGDRNGNTTLEDALRNKIFITKYWQNNDIRGKIIKTASQAYTDVSDNDTYAITGAINAYYNLLESGENPSAFNPTQSLTREGFYSLMYKTENGVKVITPDKAFAEAVGGETPLTKFAQEVDELGFLSVSNKSLDASSYKGSISRAEAVYMLVNQHFKDQLDKVTGKEKAFKDTKNAGDLALKANFKYKDKETKAIVSKDRWQTYTLAYMLQNPKKGMQEELYKTMVVAKQLELIKSEDSRWDEPISKSEAIELIVNTYLAKNQASGYLSEVEAGKINLDKFKIAADALTETGKVDERLSFEEGWAQISADLKVDPRKKLSNGISLWEAKLIMDDYLDLAKELNYPWETIKKRLDGMAQEFGVSLEELKSCPSGRPEAPKAETPKSNDNTEKGGTSGGSTSKGGSGGYVEPTKPSGGNQEDDFDPNNEHKSDGGGGTTPYDGPGLGSLEDQP